MDNGHLQNPIPIDFVPAYQKQRCRKSHKHSEAQHRGKGVHALDRAMKEIGSIGEGQAVGNRAQETGQA